jgi:amino acid adenylation domain-containing protein
MSDSPKHSSGWSARKSEALARRLREKGLGLPAGRQPLRRRDGAKIHAPLSFAQERLWAFEQLMPGTPAYNLPCAARVEGRLDLVSWERAVGEMLRRHEVLRTTFEVVGDKPAQVVSSPAAVVPLADLTGLTEEERQRVARRQARAEAERPFDLTRGPLLRLGLLRLRPTEHVLLLTMHHIISDRWSLEIFLREAIQLYNAFHGGKAANLPELPVQYADFAEWQRGRLQGETLEAELAYWKRQLAGSLPVLELPLDRQRPAAQGFGKRREAVPLPAELAGAVAELSRREGATPFMTLLAAFKTLLHRYTGQDDIVVGTPVAGRTRAETEGLIGFFVNTLVLRTRLSGDGAFAELLGRVREVCLEAFAHQEVPFDKLIETLRPARDLSHAPLIQVIFSLLGTHGAAGVRGPEAAGLTLSDFATSNDLTQFDLNLVIHDTPRGQLAVFEYNPDLFEAETVRRIARHFRALLGDIVADPRQPLHRLRMLEDEERRRLLVGLNQTGRLYEGPACLHQLFEAQAARTPDGVALVYEDLHLSYRQLDASADRLARGLRARGVGPESIVAVLLPRGPRLAIALLAALKAGAAYLPLDPEAPPQRLRALLSDSGAALLLADAQNPAGDLEAPEVLTVEEGRGACTATGGRAPCGATGENPAYVIYTSGSTGRPKGVVVPHRGVVNRLLWMQGAYGLTPSDRVLQKTPATFDVSVWEFFWPLASGAQLVLAQPGGHKDPAYLVGLIRRQQVTTMHFVPAMLRVFLEEPEVETCRTLRLVFSSGEALGWEQKEKFFERLGGALHNLYGPTEASIDVTYWACERGGDGRVPIGRPIANTQTYVLDRWLEPVAVGVPGELFIGGVGLARGYLGRPELTAESFVPAPFGPPAARLYRSRDRARLLPGGEIEYLGRLDEQVKVRGYRIEPGEIESVLRRHAAVKEAVVVARAHEATGDARLVAYVVPAEGPTPGAAELRRHLKEQLPDYMVPAHFVMLAELPLTASGKVNRRALPGPGAGARESAYVAPRTPVEEELARIWTELLGVERVGVHENFFELGGHSLLLTQLASRVRKSLFVELPLRVLFDAPTIEEMTVAIAERQMEQEDGDALAEMLAELAQLSPEEIGQALLAGDELLPAPDGLN